MNKKMREQWFAGVIQKHSLGESKPKWYSVSAWDDSKRLGDNFYPTEEAARKALDHAYQIWNKTHIYNSKGERYETSEAAPGIGVSVVCTPETDDRMRIVKHIVRKRYISEWEVVEEK